VQRARNIFGSRKGQSGFEAGLILIPLLVFIFGIIDTSLALWVRSTLEHAAREGARYAITYATQSGLGQCDSIKRVVVANSVGLLTDADVSVTFWDGSNPSVASTNLPDNVVVVSAQRNWVWITRLAMGASNLTIRASSADRMESLGAGQSPPPM
jgi:Flp pilus assembly protein TadG